MNGKPMVISHLQKKEKLKVQPPHRSSAAVLVLRGLSNPSRREGEKPHFLGPSRAVHAPLPKRNGKKKKMFCFVRKVCNKYLGLIF